MKDFLLRLLPFEKYEIKTKLSKSQIIRKVESATKPQYDDYRGGVTDDSFWIADRAIKKIPFGHRHNSFVPVIRAKLREEDGFTVISVLLRMNFLVAVIFVPLYFISALLFVFGIIGCCVGIVRAMMGVATPTLEYTMLIPFPFFQLLTSLCFRKPADDMKDWLYMLLLYE